MPISLHHAKCVLLRPARSAKAKQPSAAELREYGKALGLGEIEWPKTLSDRDGIWYGAGEGHALRVRLAEQGARFEEATPIPGWRRCYVFDPFGNKIELDEIPAKR